MSHHEAWQFGPKLRRQIVSPRRILLVWSDTIFNGCKINQSKSARSSLEPSNSLHQGIVCEYATKKTVCECQVTLTHSSVCFAFFRYKLFWVWILEDNVPFSSSVESSFDSFFSVFTTLESVWCKRLAIPLLFFFSWLNVILSLEQIRKITFTIMNN